VTGGWREAAAAAPPAAAIKVLLVDDEQLIRTGLRVIINAEPDFTVVGEAADGSAVLPLIREANPDVVLMDVRMPGVDGITATRQVVTELPAPPKVVVVTTFENDEYVYDALLAGAAGFLLKRAEPDELIQAVRIAARGESLLFPAAIRRLAGQFGGRRRITDHGLDLTEREAEVLRLMARGLSNVEIAGALDVGAQTVKTHVSNILTKLRVRDRTQAVIAAYESGFLNPRG
jgi:DNA-binding NarL/FixJ family response regulator